MSIYLSSIDDFINDPEETPVPQSLISENMTSFRNSNSFTESMFGTYIIQSNVSGHPTWKPTTPDFIVTVSMQHTCKFFNSDNIFVKDVVYFQITSHFPVGKNTTCISVSRNVQDFDWIHDELKIVFKTGIVLPVIDKKNPDIRGVYERYLNRLVHHPILRNTECLNAFLWCGGENNMYNPDPTTNDKIKVVFEQSQDEWVIGKNMYQETRSLELKRLGKSAFFKRVYHPEIELPNQGKSTIISKFETHLELVDSHTSKFMECIEKTHSNLDVLANNYKSFSESLTSIAIGNSSDLDDVHGRLIREFSFCWREGCNECRKLSKSIVQVSTQFTSISDDIQNLKSNQLLNEVKELKINTQSYKNLIQLHDIAKSKSDGLVDRGVVSDRLDTIMLTTLAEVEHYHASKSRNWKYSLLDYIEGMISVHESILDSLKKAREYLI